MPEFFIIIGPKIFSRILGGHVPPAPVSYAYGPLAGSRGRASVLGRRSGGDEVPQNEVP